MAYWLILALCGLALIPAATAHSLSIIEGEALVHRDNVELALKVMPEDIMFSAGMTLILSDHIDKALR